MMEQNQFLHWRSNLKDSQRPIPNADAMTVIFVNNKSMKQGVLVAQSLSWRGML